MYTILLNIIIYELMHGVLLYQTNNNGDTKANIVKNNNNNHRYRRYFIDVNIFNLMGDIFLLIT